MSKLVRETPPTVSPGRKRSQMWNNMLELADTPGEWGRIHEPTSQAQASKIVFDLRGRKRTVPFTEANWEFVWGIIPGSQPAKFGIWARVAPGTDDDDPDDDEGDDDE